MAVPCMCIHVTMCVGHVRREETPHRACSLLPAPVDSSVFDIDVAFPMPML